MDLNIRIVCRPEIAPGFELAGLRADTAIDGASARVCLAVLADDPDVGLVLLEERLQRALPVDFAQRLERRARPLVATFPSPHFGAGQAAEEAVLELLRRAIGYRVRMP